MPRAVVWALATAVTCTASSLGLFMFAAVGGQLRNSLCLAAELTAAAVSAVATSAASRRSTGADRRGWTLLTATIVLTYSITLAARFGAFGPRPAFVAAAVAAPLAIWALATFGSQSSTTRAWFAVLLEVFCVAGALTAATWGAVEVASSGLVRSANEDALHFDAIDSGNDVLLAFVCLSAYFVVGSLAFTLLMSATGTARPALMLIGSWAALSAIAGLSIVLSISQDLSAPVWASFTWTVSPMLLAIAATMPGLAGQIRIGSTPARADRGFVVALTIGLVAIALMGHSVGWLSEPVVWLGFIILPAAAARLGITAREHREIGSRLGIELQLGRAREQELSWARETAEAATDIQRTFLARTSHELRTPLHAVLGFSELLALEPLTDTQRAHMSQVHSSAAHLLKMVDDLLDLALVEQGEVSIELAHVELRSVVSQAMQDVDAMARQRQVTIEVDEAGWREARAVADHARLRQVVTNLLSNAIKHAGGTVRVAVEPGELRQNGSGLAQRCDPFTRIHVIDEGPGIDPAALHRLFLPFDRLGADDSVEGVGLGLAVARRLCEAMEGTLHASSSIGSGSRFTITLPAAIACPPAN